MASKDMVTALTIASLCHNQKYHFELFNTMCSILMLLPFQSYHYAVVFNIYVYADAYKKEASIYTCYYKNQKCNFKRIKTC